MVSMFSRKSIVATLFVCFFVTGCKEIVYSGLVESEANNMVAVLAASGIAASRTADSKGVYALKVESSEVATAIVVLKASGYPTQQFESIGEVFSAQGIIGTPFEQHIRYIHAMNQELSRTIVEIPNVRSARVLVTAPVRGRYDREEPRARASVTINHDTNFDKAENLPQIKLLVSYAMNNLAYDDVAVAMFEANDPELALSGDTQVDAVPISSAAMFHNPLDRWLSERHSLVVFGLAGLFLIGIGILLFRHPAGKRKSTGEPR